MGQTIGLMVKATGGTGVLHRLTGVIAQHGGNIASVEILENQPEVARTYFEIALPDGFEALLEDLRQ